MYLENDNDNIAMALRPMRVHSGICDCMAMSQHRNSDRKEGVATATISLRWRKFQIPASRRFSYHMCA